jgi:CheY-like chemotaxis protein
VKSWDSLRPVLVLEDDPELRHMLTRFLEHLGYRVVGAGDASTALELCADEPPCLIFADLMLPHVDGEAFVAELQRRYAEAAPPVVILSASAILAEVAKRVGAAASLAKPFTLDDLRDVAWRFAHTERLRQTGEAAES